MGGGGGLKTIYDQSRRKICAGVLTFRDLSPQNRFQGGFSEGKHDFFENEASKKLKNVEQNVKKHEHRLKTGRRVSFRDDSYTKMHSFSNLIRSLSPIVA